MIRKVCSDHSEGTRHLVAGLGILLATVFAATMLLMRLTVTWLWHIGRIETALQAYDVTELPILPITGERELDRIVTALNEAGRRLADARRRAEQLARQVTTGRIAAGVAHEIRNPIAAMRLKGENAAAGDSQRKDQALAMILGQIERLDTLLRRLLGVTEPEKPCPAIVALEPFRRPALQRAPNLRGREESRLPAGQRLKRPASIPSRCAARSIP
jgi:signal transduction histidine kinase